jgi:hypothetical protein
MKRLLVATVIGFVCAVAFLGVAVASDGWLFIGHGLRDVFIGPPLWLLQSGFPAVSPRLAIEPGSPYSGLVFFGAFFIVFWWLVCGMAALVLRGQPPNNSSKPTPLRGAA